MSESDKSFSPAAKRLKTSFPTLNLTPRSEIEKELDPNTCAICFFEDGKATKGEIDCCDHYFCFICIMEWSKTESRCPICRQRFSTIRRPPKFGVLASERVVQVPIRDQVAFIYLFSFNNCMYKAYFRLVYCMLHSSLRPQKQ